MNKITVERKCSTCRFWDKDDNLEYAICCRYPPTPVACSFNIQDTSNDCVYPMSGRIEGFWPTTKCTNWCGEHKFDHKKLTKQGE